MKQKHFSMSSTCFSEYLIEFILLNKSSGTELEFRSPRARQLWDKWRYVWMLAWERQRRLHDHLLHLHDLERVRQFSWDDWRKRVRIIIHFQNFQFYLSNRTINICVTVLEIHESQKISFDRLIP